jgi:hypothetical protein
LRTLNQFGGWDKIHSHPNYVKPHLVKANFAYSISMENGDDAE